jgi:uncharacterized protein (TIGR03435 family)
MPLHCRRDVAGVLALAISAQWIAFAQTKLVFEVASIKPADPAAPRPGRLATIQAVTSPGRLTMRTATLKDLIRAAYALEEYQISGGPGWIDSARFEVIAQAAGAAPRDQLLLMLQTLLSDRFHLATHRESKTVAAYAMVVAKRGKLRALAPDATKVPLPVNRGRLADLPSLAAYLTRLGSWPGQPGTPVVDKTGLAGQFDLLLDMTKIGASLERDDIAPTNETMYSATVNYFQEELGLKLEPRKLPLDVLIVDHAERPGEN